MVKPSKRKVESPSKESYRAKNIRNKLYDDLMRVTSNGLPSKNPPKRNRKGISRAGPGEDVPKPIRERTGGSYKPTREFVIGKGLQDMEGHQEEEKECLGDGKPLERQELPPEVDESAENEFIPAPPAVTANSPFNVKGSGQVSHQRRESETGAGHMLTGGGIPLATNEKSSALLGQPIKQPANEKNPHWPEQRCERGGRTRCKSWQTGAQAAAMHPCRDGMGVAVLKTDGDGETTREDEQGMESTNALIGRVSVFQDVGTGLLPDFAIYGKYDGSNGMSCPGSFGGIPPDATGQHCSKPGVQGRDDPSWKAIKEAFDGMGSDKVRLGDPDQSGVYGISVSFIKASKAGSGTICEVKEELQQEGG